MLGAILRAIDGARATARRLGHDEAGTMVMYAAAIPLFAGVVAVGAETGTFYSQKRQMQNAADAAALSASIDKLANPSISTDALNSSANSAVQRNGFSNGVNNVSVIVNSPPKSGSYVGAYGAVEVIVQKSSQSFIFGNVLNTFLGKQSASPFSLTARAVAARSSYTKTGQITTPTTTTTTSYEACLAALTPNAEQGISFTSFNNLKMDCTMASNGTSTSSDSSASIYMSSFNNATFHNNGSQPTNAGIWTRGSFYKSGYNHLTADSILTNQTTTLVDPYASLPTPAPGTCSYSNFAPSGGSAITLLPGTYCGGLTISSINNVYFTPGTYYVANGDLYITSVNNVSCPTCVDGQSGVTIVLTQTTGNYSDIGGFKISSDNNVTLSAPPSGTYKGVLVYQDRNTPVGTMTSTSKIFTISSINNAKLSGAIYFPSNRIDISSLNNAGNSTNGCTVWIGRYIKFSSYNNNYVAGCNTFGTTPAGIQTVTTSTSTGPGPVTVTASRVVE